MNKKILAGLVLVSSLTLPLAALAAIVDPTGATAPAWGDDFMTMLGTITNALFAILLMVAALAIIIAAYFFITASGDPEKTKKARDFVLYALVGVIVAFLAKALVMLVNKILH